MIARYPGRCHAACGQTIEPGDDIRMTDDGAIHADCTPRPQTDPLAATHPVCQVCWLTHPRGVECW